MRPTSPSIKRPDAVAALARALKTADYRFATVREALATDDNLTVLPHQLPMLARRLGDGPFGIFVKLFLLGSPVSVPEATRAFAPLSLQDAMNLGVVGMGRSRVHATLRIVPSDGYVFASDNDAGDPTQLPADYVMGVTESSRLLAMLTIRRASELALDVGTGCGYQAILAAKHMHRVIATDVNPRALAFARFNALLNGATNIEFRQGNLFEAVHGEHFDLIVSNPPFVISPDRAFVYRDSGLGSDQISREIVQGMTEHLKNDGLAHALVSWIHPRDETTWATPLTEWVADTACDAWLLRKGSYDPLAYATMWNQRLALANQMQKYIEAVDRWTRYFDRLGIQAMGYGAVVLHKTIDGGRVRVDELPESVDDSLGADLEQLLDVDGALENMTDIQLCERVVRVAPEHHLDQTLRWRDGGFRLLEATLVRERGLKPRAEVDLPLAALLAQIDGTRTIGEILNRTVQTMALTEDRANPFRAQALPIVRDLLHHGFLILK